MTDTDNLITTKQAAAYLAVAVHTLDKFRIEGRGPKYLRLGRMIRYRASDIDRWLNEIAEAQKKSAM